MGIMRPLKAIFLAAFAASLPALGAASADGAPKVQSEGHSPSATTSQAVNPLEMLMRQAAEQQEAANATPELTGSGPYRARIETDLALPGATLYRPADLSALGSKKLGVVIWGNGGCSNDGASAGAHLAEIASHAYLVVAPGRPLSGPAAPSGVAAPEQMKVTIHDMRAALDWALAENSRRGSPYYNRIELRAVAAAGHSCGGMLAILLGEDRRIRTVIIHNSGIFPILPDRPPLLMHEERLQGLHSPVLFIMGGKSDVAWRFGERAFEQISQVPIVLMSRNVGHGGTFDRPHGGEAAKAAVDWLEWQLRNDGNAMQTFVGPNCRLCVDPAWTVRKKGVR